MERPDSLSGCGCPDDVPGGLDPQCSLPPLDERGRRVSRFGGNATERLHIDRDRCAAPDYLPYSDVFPETDH